MAKKALFLSLFLHLFWGFLLLSMPKKERAPYSSLNGLPLQKSEVEISLFSQNKKAKQIIRQDEVPLNHKIPNKETRFLGLYNQRVKEERVKHGEGNQAVYRNKSGAQKKPSQQKQQIFNRAYDQWKQRRAPAFVKEHKEEDKEYNKNTIQPSQRTKNLRSIRTSSQFHSGTEDYIKGVKAGDKTLLNSRQFVYYSYYNRIRQQVNQYWRPHIRQALQHLALNNKYIHMDHITRLKITLDSDGYLLHIKVLRASGLVEVDAVALQAFELAAPFPNPPKNLIEEDGTINIHWSFILET